MTRDTVWKEPAVGLGSLGVTCFVLGSVHVADHGLKALASKPESNW